MKIIKKFALWSILVSALIIGGLTGLWLVNPPEKLAENSQSSARLVYAPYELDSIDLTLRDESRSTPALGDYGGDRARSLKGTIWFPKPLNPEQAKQHPLLVFSHGFGSFHKGSRHIAQHLARNGYVVAAADFPLSHARSPAGSPQLMDIVNQPGDVSAIIDHVLVLAGQPDNPLYQRIQTQSIGVYGLSLGGLTTALVSFHPDYKDDRIRASVMMAPPLQAFSERFYTTNPNLDSLIISATLDRVVPEPANALQVKPRHPKGWFLSLDKGSHLGFANVGNPIRWMTNPDDLGCAMMDRMLSKLELPDRWSKVLPNTQGVLRDIVVPPPCPELNGDAMNGLRQQWLTRIAIGAFFDMHLRSGDVAEKAKRFLIQELTEENPELVLTLPRWDDSHNE